MTPHGTGRLYSDLAWLWPIISPPSDYVEETTEYAALIRHSARGPVRRLLNLGCGGGHHDNALKAHFDITGIDISTTMLERARQLNPGAHYLVGDMRSIRLGQTFDAVTLFDSVNYMVTEADLRASLETAFLHLRPGGVLLTIPEITTDSFVQNKTFCSRHRQGELEVVFIENHYDPDLSDTSYDVSFVFLIRSEGQIVIETDNHTCGVFPLATWETLLQGVGFTSRLARITLHGEDPQECPVFVCTREN